MISRIGVALASLLVAGCVSAEQVANQVMAQCDGLGTRVRSTPDSRQGVASCTAALTSLSETNPDNWTRKISILQSRALHRLVENDAPGAVNDLDEADKTAVGQDIYYQRSLGLNTQFIRALALAKSDKKAEAEQLAVKAQSLRPYSRDTALAALTVISLDGDQKAIDDLLLQVARVHPNLSDLPFKNYFESGRFEQALAIAGGVRPAVIPEYQTYDMRVLMSREESVRATDAEFWIDIDGHQAYALAALGRKDEALAMLASAEKRIAAAKVALAPLPAKPTEEQRIRRVVQDEANRLVDAKAKPMLDFWTKLTQARLAKNNNDLATGVQLMKDVKLASPTLVAFEYEEGGSAEVRAKLLAGSATLRAVAVGLPMPSPKLMFEFLLNPEYASGVSQGIDPLTGLFMSDDDKARGGCSEGKTKEGWDTICFKSLKTAPNMAEEQAILRVADRAAAQGAVSFVIERREDIRYSVTTTNYGVPLGTYDDGYESRLSVRFFKAGAPEADCWRCLKVDEVRSALAPIYRPAAKT